MQKSGSLYFEPCGTWRLGRSDDEYPGEGDEEVCQIDPHEDAQGRASGAIARVIQGRVIPGEHIAPVTPQAPGPGRQVMGVVEDRRIGLLQLPEPDHAHGD